MTSNFEKLYSSSITSPQTQPPIMDLASGNISQKAMTEENSISKALKYTAAEDNALIEVIGDLVAKDKYPTHKDRDEAAWVR